LPNEIFNLINLQLLDLKNNKLESFPTEIGNLINLQYLCLQYNQLKSLPTEIVIFNNIYK
jgi:Leucine-rich repeat (LRR) protein